MLHVNPNSTISEHQRRPVPDLLATTFPFKKLFDRHATYKSVDLKSSLEIGIELQFECKKGANLCSASLEPRRNREIDKW